MKKIFIGAFAALALVACKKDDDTTTTSTDSGGTYSNVNLSSDKIPDERTFDAVDAQTITDELTIEDATSNTGTPPAPSTDDNAPTLYDFDSDAEHATTGGKVKIDLELQNGEVAGIYMKVPGANEYFDIPAKTSSFKKDYTQSIFSKAVGNDDFEFRSNDNEYFELELPDNLTGEFCFNYCVYDTAGLVSNVVSQCVVIESIGGELPFSHSSWKVLHFFETEDGNTIKRKMGEADAYSDTISGCYNSETFEYDTTYLEITEESHTINYAHITFNTDGTLAVSSGGKSKDVDYLNWSCEDGPVQYIEDTFDDSDTGYWNYDSETGVLVLIFGDEGEQYVDENILSVDGDNLMMSYGDEESIEAIVLGKN